MRKEILSGLSLGAVLAVIFLIRNTIWQYAGFYEYGEHWLWLTISVSVSLIFVVVWGTLSGSMIPLVLKRFKLDPAIASAPFVATLVDVTGLIIYFSIAAMFLVGKLL
jgi:magnesium transporter